MASSMLHQSAREQFHLQHGGDDVSLYVKKIGMVVYPDGACLSQSHLGAMREPPADPYKLALMKLAYQEEKLERALDKFAERKQQLIDTANGNKNHHLAPPGEEALASLKVLRKKALIIQIAVKAAKAEVEKHEPPQLREMQARAIESSVRNEEFKAAVNAIKI